MTKHTKAFQGPQFAVASIPGSADFVRCNVALQEAFLAELAERGTYHTALELDLDEQERAYVEQQAADEEERRAHAEVMEGAYVDAFVDRCRNRD